MNGGDVHQLNGSEVHQLNGGEIHQLGGSEIHQPVYEAPGSYPPVYEKEASFVSTVSLPASIQEDTPIVGRNSAFAKLEQR
jgi:hypothetical protein